MESMKLAAKPKNTKPRKRNLKIQNIYTESILSKNVFIDINLIDNNIKQTLEKQIIKNIEGKCICEGFIKPDSCKIISYSSGLIYNGNKIKFEIVFKCKICLPVEGMLIDCVVKNITKAGIKAEIGEDISPVIIFIARDHHYNNDLFSDVNENDKITVRVIGQKFELNDKYISVIASLSEIKNN
jgi:DNA-directed RNA polymerase subunit E'/Rpb7